jgi:pimeloyl-ACP methyl ester carboxylesterase
VDDPEDASLASSYAMSMVPVSRRVDGWVNDFDQFRAMDVDAWPLEQIAAPTLIVHGDADQNAPYAGSVAVAARIPNAELVTFAGAGHEFVLTQAREIDAEIERFLDGLGL